MLGLSQVLCLNANGSDGGAQLLRFDYLTLAQGDQI